MNTEKDIEFIDSYLEGTLSTKEQKEFEDRIVIDEEFNNTYQFILSVREAGKIADEVQRIKSMLNSEPFEGFGDDLEHEGKVINIGSATAETDEEEKIGRESTFNIWPFLKYAGIAATIAIVFLVWQPTRSTNEEIFVSYQSGELSLPQIAFNSSSSDEFGSNLRGEEALIEGYTYDETQSIVRAVEFINNQEYAKANKVLTETLKPKEDNPRLLLLLSVAQLNSNDVNKAVSNLENLNKQEGLAIQEAVKFHLAMGYIKVDRVRDARALLRKIEKGGGEYSSEASAVLDNMRWLL